MSRVIPAPTPTTSSLTNMLRVIGALQNTDAPVSNVLQFIDAAATNYLARFYRGREE